MDRATIYSRNPFGAGACAIVLVPCLLAGCANNPRVAQDAAIGGLGGAAVGAVVPGVSVIEGAAAGAAIGGLAGAVWSDSNNDGYVDGYVQNGQYYAGTPQGYDPTLRRVASGALGGAALGAAAGAVIPGVSRIEGAVIGARAGGLSGAIWADANDDGYVDGFIYNGQYHAGAPAMAAPSRPDVPQPMYGERDGGAGGDYSCAGCVGAVAAVVVLPALLRVSQARATGQILRAPTVRSGSAVGLAAVRAWEGTNGTLTPTGLSAVFEECDINWGGLTADCQAAARMAAGNFAAVPENSRKEFVFLFKDNCPPQVSPLVCRQKIEAANAFRALPRGLLEPRPKELNEGIKTLVTIAIRASGELQTIPGEATDVAVVAGPAGGAAQQRVQVIPYSERMCFKLRADDPKKADIEPEARPDRTIGPDGICMDVAGGGGALKYDPSWWVTPHSDNPLELYLDTEYFVGTEKRRFNFQPRPLVLKVIAQPSTWDKVDRAIRRLTATVNLAVGLADALKAFFASIAAWGIWAWRKQLAGWWKAVRSPRTAAP